MRKAPKIGESFYPDVKGSAAYVAIERVTGTLNGRSGSFVLQHTGTMTSSAQQQSITEVQDSVSAPRSCREAYGQDRRRETFLDLEYTLP